MFWNYLRIAFRSLRRRSGYATLNLVGLAVGMACCLLIGLYVQNELSYDRSHPNADRIVRVAQETKDGGLAWIGDAILPILNDRMPQVEKTVRVTRASRQIAHERGGTVRRFEEDGFFYADTTFFEVFSGFTLQKGNPKTALDQPGTVVLTPEVARRYFGDEDPMGQTLQLENRGQILTVTGVLEPIPSNSHLQPDLVSGFGTFFSGIGRPANYRSNSFWWPKAWTYALLKPGANRGAVERQLSGVVESERQDETASKYETALQPLTSLHLRSNLEGEPRGQGSITQVYVFGTIALFVLLIAAVNFINLATARAADRATEVGVRKAIGARRGQLIGQFLGEAMLLSVGAAAGGVLLVQATLPAFTNVLGRELAVGIWENKEFWAGVAAIVLVTGIGAGSYPAFVLARFHPAATLKNITFRGGLGGQWLRKGLVVFQFALSVALIGATAVAYSQLEYLRTARLGFEEEKLITLDAEGNYAALKKELGRRPEVRSVTAASVTPGLQQGIPFSYEVEGQPPADRRERLVMQRVGLNFFDVLGVETAAGRVFSGDRPGDLGRAVATEAGPAPPHYRGVALVVNQSVLKKFDWTPEEALGKRIRLYNRDDGTLYQDVRGKVTGVVENYHTASLRQKIPPTVYAPTQAPVPGEPESTYREVQSILVKATPGIASRAMEALQAAWTDVLPDEVFQASFLDDQLQAQYRSEQRLGRVIGVFAGLAILVACLGLFGLATYTTQRRTKEIGIRKAVGASVSDIVVLLSTDFLKLVAAAVTLGIPVAYLAARQWLENFAYRIDLGLGPFALAAGVAFTIAALTVSYHAVRAARLDPTLTLRDE